MRKKKQRVSHLSKRKIKSLKEKKQKAKFHSINVPVELWPSYIDFLWGSVINVTPGTLSQECISFIKFQVMKAKEDKTITIENNKIKI